MKKTFLTVLLTIVIMVLASCNNSNASITSNNNEVSTPMTEEKTINTYKFKTTTSIPLWDDVEPEYKVIEIPIDFDIPEGNSDVPPIPTEMTKVLINTPPRVLVRLTLTGDDAFACIDDLQKVGFIKYNHFFSRNVCESDDTIHNVEAGVKEKKEYSISAEKEMSYKEALNYVENDYIEINAETLYNDCFDIIEKWSVKTSDNSTQTVNAK